MMLGIEASRDLEEEQFTGVSTMQLNSCTALTVSMSSKRP